MFACDCYREGAKCYTGLFAFSERKPKRPDTLQHKRKQYRKKKKALVKERKLLNSDIKCKVDTDSGYTTCPNAHKPPTSTVSTSQCGVSDQASSVLSASLESVCESKDWPWAVLDEEAKGIRQTQLTNEAKLVQKYSTYVDPEPAFVYSPTKPDIPQNITGVDRVLVTSKISNIVYKKGRQ